jgi:hypothetical protein
VLIAACSGSEAATTTSTTTASAPATTSTRPTTTTRAPTTTVPLPTSPINGLPVEDEALLERRVMAVKIDNHANARPQSGLDLADAVVEVPVEGITRFIALFHDADAEYLGPVRSGRPSDGRILNPLGATFAISGGQDWVLAGIRREGVDIIGEVRPAMFRIAGRSAPHDLYTDTTLLRQLADERDYPDDPPPQLFEFGDLPPTADAATEIALNFGNGFIVTWIYDEAENRYLRQFGGRQAELIDQEGVRSPLGADVLVVMLARRYTEQAPAGATSVPAIDTVGEGVAHVFADGLVMTGNWSRATSADLIVLTDDGGEPLPVPPGFIWVSFVPEQTGLDFS